MLATMKHVVLVLLIAALPAQALAAIIQPICHEDRVASAAPAHHQAHAESEHHHHDAPSLDHGHPLTMGDLSLDHCSSGCAFALPATMTKLPIMPGPEHDSLTAARFTGHVPEQPQRPPRS